jgi:hypothetical protein
MRIEAATSTGDVQPGFQWCRAELNRPLEMSGGQLGTASVHSGVRLSCTGGRHIHTCSTYGVRASTLQGESYGNVIRGRT